MTTAMVTSAFFYSFRYFYLISTKLKKSSKLFEKKLVKERRTILIFKDSLEVLTPKIKSFVSDSKASSLRNIFLLLILPLRKKFESNMLFLFRCLDEYCKTLKRDKLAKHTNLFEIVLKCRNRHKEIENFNMPRMNKIRKELLKTGEYQILLKTYVKENKKNIKEFEELYYYFPEFLKLRITYLVESQIYNSKDIVNYCNDETIHNELVLRPDNVNQCCNEICLELTIWNQKLRSQVDALKSLIKNLKSIYTGMLQTEYHELLTKRYFEFVREYNLTVDSFSDFGREDPAKEHIKIADQLRVTSFLKNLFKNSSFNIENETIFQKPEWSPLFFQETYERKALQKSPSLNTPNFTVSSIRSKLKLGLLYKSVMVVQKKRHLIVLVHGYGGSHYDMSIYKNFLSKIIPHSVFLPSKSNEDMNGKRIAEMGLNLAIEIIAAVKNHHNIGKISFIGHSLGGIIARASLHHLKDYKGKMFTYVSLSSPHLGTKKNKSFLVNAGMFFLNKIKKDVVIAELQMDDKSKFRDTFMYNLAREDKLFWFNNILLFSSPQDTYVPYSSARIQPAKPSSNSKVKQVLFEMSEKIWSKVNNDMVVRVDVDLRSSEK